MTDFFIWALSMFGIKIAQIIACVAIFLFIVIIIIAPSLNVDLSPTQKNNQDDK